MTMRIIPLDLKTANEFVRKLHRHSRPVVGHKFSIGVEDADHFLRGVVIVGRPVARALDDGMAAEITRLCTDGTRNACSMLYGAARRAAKAMGHDVVYTYTLPDEGGASLRAAGFTLDKSTAGGPYEAWHNRPGRKATPVGDDLVGGKWRWVAWSGNFSTKPCTTHRQVIDSQSDAAAVVRSCPTGSHRGRRSQETAVSGLGGQTFPPDLHQP